MIDASNYIQGAKSSFFSCMLAMENKSLNVFNTSCVLADPKTSSDANYARVEGIIGHVRDIIVWPRWRYHTDVPNHCYE